MAVWLCSVSRKSYNFCVKKLQLCCNLNPGPRIAEMLQFPGPEIVRALFPLLTELPEASFWSWRVLAFFDQKKGDALTVFLLRSCVQSSQLIGKGHIGCIFGTFDLNHNFHPCLLLFERFTSNTQIGFP